MKKKPQKNKENFIDDLKKNFPNTTKEIERIMSKKQAPQPKEKKIREVEYPLKEDGSIDWENRKEIPLKEIWEEFKKLFACKCSYHCNDINPDLDFDTAWEFFEKVLAQQKKESETMFKNIQETHHKMLKIQREELIKNIEYLSNMLEDEDMWSRQDIKRHFDERIKLLKSLSN